jgi:ATP-dependent DNA ligase
MSLDSPPPRDSRFGSPLELSRVHWVRPEMVVEVAYFTWTEDNLLRQVSYLGVVPAAFGGSFALTLRLSISTPAIVIQL